MSSERAEFISISLAKQATATRYARPSYRRVKVRMMGQPEFPETQSRRSPPPRPWMKTVKRCLRHKDLMNRWEVDFLGGLDRFPRLSAKQHGVLDKLAQRIKGRPVQRDQKRRAA
jgi:hypothetical protein